MLNTLDEPDLPAKSLEEDKQTAKPTINKKASNAPDDSGKSDPKTGIMMDPTQCKARCILAPALRCDPGTDVWSGESPTLLENRDVSEIPDILPKSRWIPYYA